MSDLIECPMCGRRNSEKEVFRCKGCGTDNLCLRHQDERTFVCHTCQSTANQHTSDQVKAKIDKIASEMGLVIFLALAITAAICVIGLIVVIAVKGFGS